MSSFCNSGQSSSGTQNGTQTNQTGWSNPLGPSSIGPNGQPIFTPSGASQLGGQTLSYLAGLLPAMNQGGQNTAAALSSAAANPAWGAVQSNAARTAAGDYLAGSPQLDTAMAQNRAIAGAGAADAAARQRSMMDKNGMGWGTGAQQTQQAATAQGNEAAANTNALAYLQNYQAERGAQNQSGNQLAQALSGPLSYLSAIPGALTSGLTPAAQLISGLGSGGQLYSLGSTNSQNTTDSGTYNPSIGSDILNAIGAL